VFHFAGLRPFYFRQRGISSTYYTKQSSDIITSTSTSTMSGKSATKQVQDVTDDNENAIKVIINGRHEKICSIDWLAGKERAADSILAMQLFGTKEGLKGTSCELRLEESLVPAVDLMIIWLTMGDDSLKSNLTQENVSKIYALAQFALWSGKAGKRYCGGGGRPR
jgi:hypothetical protein